MTSKKDIPRCGYMSSIGSGNRNPKCSHKHCSKLCIYKNNPEKCDSYMEWFEAIECTQTEEKWIPTPISRPLTPMGDNTNEY